jgi:hypothetical protein
MNPGTFKTSFAIKCDVLPQLPAYKSMEPSNQMRGALDMLHQGVDLGFPKPEIFVDALMQVVDKKERGEEIPFRVPVGHDSLGLFRKKISAYSESVDKLESLSKECKHMAPQ